MTPSFPTLSIASEIKLPIDESLFAEIVPTCEISSFLETSLLIPFKQSRTCSTALSIPLLISIGFAPAVTFFKPSETIDCARTVAVVVPSPAISDVLDATSRTI